MKRRILTLKDLLAFYENHFSSNVTFDAKEFGGPLVVSAENIGCFEQYDSHEGLMFLKFKVCHTGVNRNGSRISEEDMEKAMPSLMYRPVLAYIKEDENGDLDFGGHEFTVNDDESITYYESQVGSFTADEPTLEYDEENDKTYVVAYAVIPKDYTQAAEIIERKNGTKVSCELCINSMAYDSKDKILNLTDFYFNGVTLLGESIGEGMLGSRADKVESIESFTEKNNSIVASIQQTDEMIKKLNDAIQVMSNTIDVNLNTKTNFAEGGDKPMKLDELLEKYGKTAEDLDFDYQDMSDEELEAKFEELFSENNAEDHCEANNEEDKVLESQEEPKSDVYSLVVNGKEYTFEVSLNNKICALEELVNDSYSEEDGVYYCVEVYDDYVIMTDHWTNKSYKQSYSEEDEVFTLVGERAEVYVNYLTEEEEEALDEMRDSYADMQARLNGYEEAEANAAKEEIFNSDDYELIREEEDFVELRNNASEYTVDEVQAKCDAILLSYIKNKKTYSYDEKKESASKKRVNIGAKKEETYSPYGSLFANK